MKPLIKRAALLGTAAVAVSASLLNSASAPVFASPSLSSATSTPVATRQSSSTSNQYTRYTFDMTGSWKLVSTGSVAVDPGAGANTFYTRFTRIDNLSPIANDPVYEGDVFGQNCEYAGEFFATPYVTPRGIVLTIWQVGNTELQAGGYEAVYTVRSANTTQAPLNFTGDWLDQDGKLGSVQITRSSRLLFNTTPCS